MKYWQFVFKNLRNNYLKNIFLLIGLILNFAFTYCFLFLDAVLQSSEYLWIAWNYGSMTGAVNICIKIVVLSGFFLSMSIAFPYIKERIREYGLLLVLGIQKNMMCLILGMEYLLIWVLTVFAGLLLGLVSAAMIYGVLRSSGYPVWEVRWIRLSCTVCGKVILLSIIYIVCVFVYLLVRMENQNLSVLASEPGRPEKQKDWHKSLRMGIAGMIFIAFSLMLQFPTCHWKIFLKWDEAQRALISLIFCIVGIYLLIASGMSVVLACVKKNERYFFKNILSLRNMMFHISSYKNLIFSIVLINFALLFYIGDNIQIFQNGEKGDYNWRYPYDFIGSMGEEDIKKWKTICQENELGNELLNIPYADIWNVNGIRFIGIPESGYKKMTAESIQLEKNETCLCLQYPMESDEWDDEESIFFCFGEEIKEYTIEIRKKEILVIGLLSIDGHAVNVAIFEDEEFNEISKKLNSSRLLVLQDFEKGGQTDIEHTVQKFKQENPQVSGITQTRALVIEDMTDRVSVIIYAFCALCLELAGLSMLGIKLFSEIFVWKKKYCFLSDVGMEQEQIKKEVGKEIRCLMFIPAVLGAFLAAIYKANILGRYIQLNSEHHFYAEDKLPVFIWEMSRDWLCVLFVFILVQLLYGKYIVSYIRRKVAQAVSEKEEI